MSVCTFFGHRDTSIEICPKLKETIINLIEKNNVNMFYVGNHGQFDKMTRTILKQLKIQYPHINYYVVLAYMPSSKNKNIYEDYSDSIYPEGLENTPPKYSIIKRNEWMINHSDYVIVYCKHSFGGTEKFKNMALKKKKTVINIAETEKPT